MIPQGPTATYRLQLNASFTLRDARSVLPYLHRLGISHLYCSPILRARRNSTHGYDVVDPRAINPQLGTEDDLRRLAHEAAQRGMGLILDIVPNHMAIGDENPYWEDVLQHGPASAYARWFDIDWDAAGRRVFLPVLGSSLRRAITEGVIRLDLVRDSLRVVYHDQSFPLDPATIPLAVDLASQPPPNAPAYEVLDRLRRLPPRDGRRAVTRGDRMRRAEPTLEHLTRLIREAPEVRRCFQQMVEAYSTEPVGPRALQQLLAAQPYRLAYWRRAAREINYRRFFTVSHLIAMRQEDPEVFHATHERVLQWIQEGLIHGLRIDHVDGLLDPAGYLTQLYEATSQPQRMRTGLVVPIYVEKILGRTEALPSWPIAGTTGYDFLPVAEEMLLDPVGVRELEEIYHGFTDRPTDFARIARDAKRRILQGHLSADVSRLTRRLESALRELGYVGPWQRTELTRALIEAIVHLDAYRAYPDATTGALTTEDRVRLRKALDGADTVGRISSDAVALLRKVLLPDPGTMAERAPERLTFVQRFQQVSVPATAKGVEDTIFYTYVPLISRNEVGSEPYHPLEDATRTFHRCNDERGQRWPGSLLCVSTHDTKRSADVRARLDVLSEIPRAWSDLVKRWHRRNRKYRTRVQGRYAPDANTEYLLYQTLIGMWPLTDADTPRRPTIEERLREYMVKAVREAKVHTSWVEPNEAFEQALLEFTGALFGPEETAFRDEVHQFVARISHRGWWNGLARTVIQMTVPGVPDVYQGDELWSYCLVDPDNRRPIDFAERQKLLDELTARFDSSPENREVLLDELVKTVEDGRLKLHVIHRLLGLRRLEPSMFAAGSYHELDVSGPAASAVVAFGRRHGSRMVVTVAPRLVTPLLHQPDDPPVGETVWGETAVTLPAQLRCDRWRCELTSRLLAAPEARLGVAEVLGHLPVAVLLSCPTT